MRRLEVLNNPALGRDPGDGVEGAVVLAYVADTVTDPLGEFEARIPAYDMRKPFGPFRFSPVPAADGKLYLPARDDSCVLSFDEDGEAALVSWWPAEGSANKIPVVDSVVVTALPGAPIDGQTIRYQTAAMAVPGVIWTFRYNAASASSYKWECMGGAWFWSSNEADETFTTNTGVQDATTAGPSIALPLSGDWAYTMHSNMYVAAQTVNGNLNMYVVINDGIVGNNITQQNHIGGLSATHQREGMIPARTAAEVFKLKYQGGAVGGTGHCRYRWVGIRPIRVG